jgi:hypothetical protein
MTAKVGDWVRFYRNGTLDIGVVCYVRKNDLLQTEDYLTDQGSVHESQILEVR